MKALILSAGFGSRMTPITDTIPKPLVPVLNTPVIEYSINLLKHYGIGEFFINLHHGADKIMEYLGDGSRYGISITYLHEKEILGTGGAIGSLKGKVDETLIVINSDTIFDFNLEEMIDFHFSRKDIVTLGLLPASPKDPRAVLTVDKAGTIIRILDKAFFYPLPEGEFIFTGIHIIEPHLFEYIPSEIFVSITNDIYSRMVEDREAIGGFAIKGKWWDMGTPDAYYKCSFELMDSLPLSYFNPLKRFALCPECFSRENLVVMGKVDKIPAVPINPPVIIADNVKLEEITHLGPNLIIGSNVRLDRKKEVENAIYFPNAGGKNFVKVEKGIIYY